jgi:positive regulator of sigma E activity
MIGRVHAVRGKEVLIVPEENAACFGCMKDCHKHKVLVAVENRDTLPLEPGQMVETEHSPYGLLCQGLITLLPLVLGFLAGFLFIRFFFPAAGEGAMAAGGAFFLFAAGAAVLLIHRRYPAKEINRIKQVIAGGSRPDCPVSEK